MVEVSVAIVEKYEQVLVCQRKRSTRYALQWEFPGGKVENGETAMECLQRELKEELNITAEIGECLLKKTNVYPDGGIFTVSYFLVHTYRGRIRNKIFEKIVWIDIAELSTLPMLAGNREIVQILNEKQ